MTSSEVEVPQGRFVLHRHPPARDPSLRAWDAADVYLARYLAGEEAVGIPPAGEPPAGSWVVVDHRAGALAVILHARRPTLWSDSALAHEAARRNLSANGLAEDTVPAVPSTEVPAGPVAVALVKVPRTLAYLEDLLARLRPALAPGALVLGAGMTRDVHTSTIDAFAAAIGPTVTSHAWRKARLLHATLDPEREPTPSPSPARVELTEGVISVVRPGVFAGDRLDGGTALLLASTPWDELVRCRDVVDLGCGSGVLGVRAGVALPDATITFVDESYAAVASAVASAEATLGEGRGVGVVDDAGATLEDDGADLVLCNPPFHAQGARLDDVAERMFDTARRVLRPGGTLLVVGNRHLGYHVSLGRRFARVEVVGSDPRFVVVRADR